MLHCVAGLQDLSSLTRDWTCTLGSESTESWSLDFQGIPVFVFIFFSFMEVKVKVLVAQSCLTLCDPMDCSPPGSSIHGILQTRILEWVAISFSTGSHYLLSLVTMDEMASTHFLNEKSRFQVSPAFKGEVKSLEWNQNREEPTRGMQAKYAKLPQKNSKARLLLRLCTWKHPYQHHTSWLKFRHII